MSLKDRAKKLKLLILDVDGVLTDGTLYYESNGETIKTFNVHDGMGIKLLQKMGIKVAVISGRSSESLKTRLKELGVEYIFLGVREKEDCLRDILSKEGIKEDEVAFVGDDLVDVPIMERVGFPIAVRNSVDEVKEKSCYITLKEGGRGAVREVADLLLKLREL